MIASPSTPAINLASLVDSLKAAAESSRMRILVLLSRGDPATFFEHPMALVFLIVTAILLVAGLMPRFTRARNKAIGD